MNPYRRWLVAVVSACGLAHPLSAAGIADQEVAFLTKRDGNFEIYLKCRDGREVNLTTHPGYDYGMSWSPDGSKLAFATRRDGNEEIYELDLGSGGLENLTSNPATDTQPRWSPDGRLLAFFSDREGDAADPYDRRELYLLERGTGAVRRLTRNALYEEAPSWSADGRSVVFCRMRARTGDGDPATCDLWSIEVSSGDERRLTDRPGFSSSPDATHAGAPILFHGRDGERYELLALDLASGAVANLTRDAREDWQPAWSHDGTEIVWCAGERPHEFDLWVMKADGSDRRPLVEGPGREEWPVPRPVTAAGGPCAAAGPAPTSRP
jgi:TolB protein